MTDPQGEDEEDIAAVENRIAQADSWSKETGYPAREYWDVLTDLRFMVERFRESEERVKTLAAGFDASCESEDELRSLLAAERTAREKAERNAEADRSECLMWRTRAEAAESEAAKLRDRVGELMQALSVIHPYHVFAYPTERCVACEALRAASKSDDRAGEL